jgi:hypothetical protein
MANIAVGRFYLRQRRSEFNPLLHLVLPVVASAYYRAIGREDGVRRAGAGLGESEAELERTVGYP